MYERFVLKMPYKKCLPKVLAIPIPKYLTDLLVSVDGNYFLAALRKDS